MTYPSAPVDHGTASPCPTCSGSGVVDTTPAGARHPALTSDAPCPECGGTGDDTAVELVLDDLTATRLVSGNRRIHHMVRAQVCAYWRRLAHDAATAAYGYADVGQTWHQRARIVVTVRFPDKRRRDVSNLYPYVAKPLVDGLIDARVLPDDDDLHVVGPDLRRDHDRGPHRITIRIEDVA